MNNVGRYIVNYVQIIKKMYNVPIISKEPGSGGVKLYQSRNLPFHHHDDVCEDDHQLWVSYL